MHKYIFALITNSNSQTAGWLQVMNIHVFKLLKESYSTVWQPSNAYCSFKRKCHL